MKILFLTLAKIESIEDNGIYTDLLRKFRDEGHNVTVICPNERKYSSRTSLDSFNRIKLLKVWTFNFQKTSILEKGFSTLSVEYFFIAAIKKYLDINDLDLILYTTPPITFTNLIKWLKSNSNASTYLLLKDIFPQNAVDLKILRENSFLHKYFKNREKEMYDLSDFIGCMSPQNVKYLIGENPQINPEKVEINPNSIEIDKFICYTNKYELLSKYNIPHDKTLFLFGGNLGLPQGIEYLKKNIQFCQSIKSAYFIIVGSGTEYNNLYMWFLENNINNGCLINELSKSQFDNLLGIVDVGLIYLNPLFTIPNFPSRILSYLKNKLPVICAVDESTDIGMISEENFFGFTCLTSDSEAFSNHVVKLLDRDLRIRMGQNGYEFLHKEYSTDISYHKIVSKI